MSVREGHACPHPDCEAWCPSSMFSCRRHWYTLPGHLRSRVWRAYRAGDLEETLALYGEADRFWRGTTNVEGPDDG